MRISSCGSSLNASAAAPLLQASDAARDTYNQAKDTTASVTDRVSHLAGWASGMGAVIAGMLFQGM